VHSRLLAAALVSALVCSFAVNCAQTFDAVVTGGTVIDGTGAPGFPADVGVKNGKITAIGTISTDKAAAVIDARGKYVVPGFIDMHTHSDRNAADEQRKSALNYLTQGVTTMVTGNCGGGTYDVAQFFTTLEKQGVGTNIVHLVGHGTVRSAVMKNADRPPTEEEMTGMKSLVEKALREGAYGLSTGLFYAPGSFAETEEIVDLCRIVKKYNGFYATHLRDESNYTVGLKAAVEEAIEIGEESGVPVQISHIKALGRPVWGMAEEICSIIEAAQERGVRVFADQYPYTASSTSLSAAVMPRWVQADGKMRERLADAALLPGIRKQTAENIDRRGGAETLVISSFRDKPEWEGKSLREISAILKKSTVDTALELVLMGSPGIISFNMSGEDVEYFMKKPYVMTSSDGSLPLFGRAMPHPRSYGTFTRKIRRYVLDKNVITMEAAIRAATGLPAEMLAFSDRGLLKEGYAADIVVFDSLTIRDTATFGNPHQYSAGIDYVFVNGKMTIRNGKYTGALAGKPLRRR